MPHGIYDLARNTGYLSIGTSHDTSEFVCGNIGRVWDSHLRQLYPHARMLVILCDGGGSNSSRHRIFKQDLMDLADRTGLKLLVMHYPPYCSKFNPIEHRLFSQITRSWSGTPLYSPADACRRAANTVTKKGLKVFAEIVDKVAPPRGVVTVTDGAEHPRAVDLVSVVLRVENADPRGVDLVDLGVLRVDVVDRVAEHTDRRGGFHSLPYEVGGVEVRADDVADCRSQFEKRLGIVAAEAGMKLERDVSDAVRFCERRRLFPVRNKDLVPLIVKDRKEIVRPRAGDPVGVLRAGMVSGTA